MLARKFACILAGVFLTLSLFIQWLLALLFTSDIPVHVERREFYLFIIFSIIVAVLYMIYLAIIRTSKSVAPSLIPLLFSGVWAFSFLALLQLEGVPSYALYMDLIGLLTSIAGLMISILMYVKNRNYIS